MKIFEVIQKKHDILYYFDPVSINEHRVQPWKSREKLIMMPVAEFLFLAKPGHDPEKEARVSKMIRYDIKFDIPHLSIDYDGTEIAKVVGHEGRHRARALQSIGHTAIPVILKMDSLRWSEQDDESKFDYKEVWPQYLLNQNGNGKRPFPVSRENSDSSFTS
jgi:hypothetical protein